MNTVQTDSRHSSLEFDSEQYSPRVLIIVRITAVALLLAAAVAGVVLLSSLPSRADALAGIFNVAFVLKTMLIALTMLVLMFVAVWPKNKVPALQSLPGGGLIFLLAGLGLLFAYEALDVTRNIFGVESNTVLSITEEVLRFLGALALLGAVALWARGLSRARLQLLEEEQRSRQGKADYKISSRCIPIHRCLSIQRLPGLSGSITGRANNWDTLMKNSLKCTSGISKRSCLLKKLSKKSEPSVKTDETILKPYTAVKMGH